MRNAVKWPIMLACAVALAIGITACGGGGSSSSTGESSSAGSSSEELSGTVEIWDNEYESIPEYTDAVNKIDAEFEALHPEVTVKRVAQPPTTFEAVYRAAFAAHEGPDVMVLQPGAFGVLSFTKGLEVLNPYISSELQDQLTQWPSATAGYTAEGDHYGVPIGVQGFVIYYNKKLFKQAGLPTDFQPKTWTEVREAGEKLKAAGIQPFTGGDQDGLENLWWFSMGFHSENTPEQTVELGEGAMPFTDEAVTKAFEPVIEMTEAGLYNSDRFSTPWFPDGYVPFQEGKAGMIIGFWNSAGYWRELISELGEKNVGFFFPPGSDSIETIANIAYGMPKFAKNKDAAWALIEYTVSKKGAEALSDLGGYLPFRKDMSVAADAPIQERELWEALQERETVLAPIGVIPSAVGFGPMITEISQVLQGRTSLEDAQKAMQETAEKTVTE